MARAGVQSIRKGHPAEKRAAYRPLRGGGTFPFKSGQFPPNALRTIFIVVSNSLLPDCMVCRRLHITGTHSVLGVYSSHAWTNRTAVQSLSRLKIIVIKTT